jgi:Acyl-protein synthetase, LuxE
MLLDNESWKKLLEADPYALERDIKDSLLLDALKSLTTFHRDRCLPYLKISDALYGENFEANQLSEVPFIPARLFKEIDFLSTEKSEVIKTMMSSGTSSQLPSRIFLDKDTSRIQGIALSKIMTSFFGKQRMPMLIIDSESTIKNRLNFSARTAGILGFSMFGRNLTFALNDDMSPNFAAIENFLLEYEGDSKLIFGFTSIIWEHLFSSPEIKRKKLQFTGSQLLHGGGWKKLLGSGVTNSDFIERAKSDFGVDRCIDYYGMVEQTGSVFFECEFLVKHTPSFSNIIIRDFENFDVKPMGKEGIIQLQSILPLSYPGHSILTEDQGVLLGFDDCPCGRKGQYFQILGRIPQAEIRGCSDTYVS